MWRRIRIGILVIVLVIAAGENLTDRFRTTSWKDTLWIGVFPVNGDSRPASDRYISALDRTQFAAIEEFFAQEAESFGVPIGRPVKMELYPRVADLPPQLDRGGSIPGRLWWNLRMLYYSWSHASDTLADIRMFVLYHDPDRTPSVPHSVGLQKGLFGVVYAYASPDMDATNNIVIAHEAMHTLGATDKYDPATDLPLFPDGYGEPDAEPRYPQRWAEIMGARTAISETEAEMPFSLDEVVVGRQTATEIGWVD